MRIFRISKTEYIDDLSGEGARLYGGRWNLVG
ncbi:MAG TPA: toxin-antitoxin system toxin subunit, partial [Aequorivita sp.]|nr:toxin-antitoxin system toxin subunit [Aequorivita sp.]